jgi:hypothetical protein
MPDTLDDETANGAARVRQTQPNLDLNLNPSLR